MKNLIQTVEKIYPYITVLLPALGIYFYIDQKRFNPYKLIKIILLAIYVTMVFSVTGTGTIYDIGKYPELIRMDEITWQLFESNGGITYYLNIIMCVPLGFLIPFIWKQNLRKVTIQGFVFSLLIETSQLLNRRNSAVDDLLMNTIGAVMGYEIYQMVRMVYQKMLKGKVAVVDGLMEQERDRKNYEVYMYLIGMFLGKFLLFNWRGYVNLFLDYYM